MRLLSLVRRVEGDPLLQYKIHKFMARVWLIITPPLLFMAIFEPVIWLRLGVAYVMVASNYANWATDNGAMSAANASTTSDITEFAIEAEIERREELWTRKMRTVPLSRMLPPRCTNFSCPTVSPASLSSSLCTSLPR